MDATNNMDDMADSGGMEKKHEPTISEFEVLLNEIIHDPEGTDLHLPAKELKLLEDQYIYRRRMAVDKVIIFFGIPSLYPFGNTLTDGSIIQCAKEPVGLRSWKLDDHLINRTALHDTLLLLLTRRLTALTDLVYSDIDETTSAKIRSTNRRVDETLRLLSDLRSRVRFLEGRVTSLARRHERVGVIAAAAAAADAAGAGGGSGGGGGGGGASAGGGGRKTRSKKRKARGGEAVDVSGDGGAAVAEELGEVETMLAEVMKRVGDFRIASGLDAIEEAPSPLGGEDTEMENAKEDKGKEVAKPEAAV
ncbi:hypothetical protein F5144DRAFT_657864 [Chaetomium tenue]|uniref:Uncharacterized protein n=1 Tax=Chaetomium tenue TaxID=1854479 RepID=A0ACB7NY74_9PEZI|nr:hypothetical protein F5144DRAFT_657864 [Chaetomium globosum]